jgi:hypothetical protein
VPFVTLDHHAVERLQSAAQSGDPEAAREYGRLLSLLPSYCRRAEMEEPDDELGDQPGARWFRVALKARPDDHEAAVLLAACLWRQADVLADAYDLDDDDDEEEEDEDEGGVFSDDDEFEQAQRDRERLRTEARRLYEGVLRADPAHPAARSGLAALEGSPFSVPYSHYLVEGDMWSGSVGCREQLVVGDIDELRWACGEWASTAGLEGRHLSVYASGERLNHTSLQPLVPLGDGSLDWSMIPVPALPGEPLPHGHPVRLDGHTALYGWHAPDLPFED